MTHQFSVLIPTHNRHEKLRRLLSYLSNYFIEVVIVDSGKIPYEPEVNDFVKYFHKPELNFKQKVIFGAEILTTDYIFLSADDDFPLIGRIEEVLNRVETKFSLLVGPVGLFNESFDGNYLIQGDKLGAGVYTEHNVSKFLGNYSQVLWGLYNRLSIIRVFRVIDEYAFENDNFIELVIAPFMASESSLIKVSDVLYVREITTEEHWGSRHIPLRETYVTKKQQFLVDFAKYLSLFKGSDAAGFIAAYLGDSTQSAGPVSLLRIKIKRVIPRSVLSLIKPWFARGTPLIADSSLEEVSEVLMKYAENRREL